MGSKDAAKLACALMLAVSTSPSHAQSLNAKTGAWEMTIKSTMSGSSLPPEALAKMPPERRAMIEKMMAEGRSSVTKTCVKKEDLDSGRFARQREGCTLNVVTKTPKKLVANTSCAAPKTTGTVTFDVKDDEHVVGVIEQTHAIGTKVRIDIAGRWLTASCDGVDTPIGGAPLVAPKK